MTILKNTRNTKTYKMIKIQKTSVGELLVSGGIIYPVVSVTIIRLIPLKVDY